MSTQTLHASHCLYCWPQMRRHLALLSLITLVGCQKGPAPKAALPPSTGAASQGSVNPLVGVDPDANPLAVTPKVLPTAMSELTAYDQPQATSVALADGTLLEQLSVEFAADGSPVLRQAARDRTISGVFLRTERVESSAVLQLAENPSLRSIQLEGGVTDEIAKALASVKSLRRVILTGGTLTDEGLRQLAELSELQELSIQVSGLTPEALSALGQLEKLRSLRVSITSQAPVSLAPLTACRMLTELTLLGAPVMPLSDELLQAFGGLESFHVATASWQRQDFEHLATLPRLKSLHLEGPLDAQALAGFSSAPALTSMTLTDPGITDAAIEPLTKIASLTSMVLRGTQVTDTGVEHLSHLKGLGYLDLSRTKVQGKTLASLQETAQLASLSLDDTDLVEAAVAGLSQVKSLKSLSLRDSALAAQATDRVRTALPNTFIDYTPRCCGGAP